MAQTVGTHGVAVFTSPSNGDTLDATVVKGNDNNLRSAYVDHDADGGLHVQSSSLATRSSPGLLGRKWLTTDPSSYRLFFDDGSAWYELSYLSTNGGTVTGNMTVTGTLTASVTGPVTGNASTATALQTARNINGVAFNGTADITVTAAAGTLSGSTLNSGVTASSLTSVGTLGTLQVSGNATFDTNTLFVDAVNNRVGVLTATPSHPFQLGSSTLIVDTSGNLGLGVVPSAWNSSYKAIDVGNSLALIGSASAADLYFNAYIDSGSTFRYRQNAAAGAYSLALGQHRWYNAPSGTAGAAISLTQAMTLDASGNLGLGVTPSAWTDANNRGLDIGVWASVAQVGGSTMVGLNTYATTSSGGWTYKNTAAAMLYRQATSGHLWFTAPSGTAGAAISFTQAMTLDASGNLLVGTASAGYGLAGRGLVEVNGSSSSLLGLKVGDVAKGYIQHTGTDLTLANQAAGSISFVTNNVSRWGMNSSGHLLAATDATYDIGASGATRPRDLFLSGRAVYGTAANRLQVGSADGVVGGIYGNATGEIVVAADAFRAFNKAANAERMRIDNTTTAGQTALMLWDVDNGTLERVTVGAADSGGAGFKVLRIPN